MQMNIGTYRPIRSEGKFAYPWYKRWFIATIAWLKVVLWRSAIICAFGWAIFAGYMLRELDQSRTVAYAATTPFASLVPIEMKGKTIDQLEDEVIADIEKCESGSQEGLIVFDQNSHNTLKGKNIASIGVMQWKVGSVQKYEKDLYGKDMSDKDAVLVALDSSEARELAKQVIFKVQGGVNNWACADDKMVIKVGLIKEMM